jgi:hypothetical protein
MLIIVISNAGTKERRQRNRKKPQEQKRNVGKIED